MPYVFDLDRLARLAVDGAETFRSAQPYPHLVIDDFLSVECAEQLAREFPSVDGLAWDHYAAPGLEVKLGSSREELFPEAHRQAIHDFNTGIFVRFLEQLTGIDHLLADPHLAGGGLHLTRKGGLLGIHADFNWNEKLEAHRRLNFLVYLTPGWQPGYGGQLEIWDTQAKALVHTIDPLFNRAVVFTTRSDTFHGHPVPWTAPDGVDRKSIAMYYYSTSRPDSERRSPHNTLYRDAMRS